MRGKGFGILRSKYFRYYPVAYGVEIRAQLRFNGFWQNARCKTDILLHMTGFLSSSRGFLSSEMRRGEVVWVGTDVSKEHIASISKFLTNPSELRQ